MSGAVGTVGAAPTVADVGVVGGTDVLDPPALPPTVHPRPDGVGWRLLDYSWENGVARFQYRQLGSGQKRTVHQLQPAHEGHAGWDQLPFAARRAKAAAAAEGARFRAGRRPRSTRGQS